MARVPVTGRAGRFGAISSSGIGVSSAHAELIAAARIPLSGTILTLLGPTVNNLFAAGCIDFVDLVVSPSEVDAVGRVLSALVAMGEIAEGPVRVLGLSDRDAGSAAALATHLPEPGPSFVLVHQVTHAYAPPELIRQVVAQLRAGAPAVVPVLPCTDTVKRLDRDAVIIDTPDRTMLRVAQSPIGLRTDRPHDPGPGLPAGTRTIPGHPAARAIRTAFDLAFAAATPVV